MRTLKDQTAPRNPNLKARKPVYHPRRAVIVASEVLIALFMLCIVLPPVVKTYQLEADAKAFVLAIATGYHAAAAEDERVVAEASVMQEFNALRLTLYCEAQGYNEEDMLAIADNVFSRIDSPAYPDTVYDVVNEVRTRADNGKKVAMYSYIFTDCPASQKAVGKWRLSGRMAAIALKQRWDGKASSGSVNYHAPYVDPTWATADVRNCLLKPLGERGYHLHYAAVAPEDRATCREERKLAARQAKVNAKEKDKDYIPVPTPRPAQDEVASLILASN